MLRPPGAGDGPIRRQEAPLACLVAICITTALTLVLFFIAGDIYDFLLPITVVGGG